MTSFGQPRWEVLDPSISYQNRKSQGKFMSHFSVLDHSFLPSDPSGMVRLQSGTNRFASQAGMTGFGTPRNTTYEAEAGDLPYDGEANGNLASCFFLFFRHEEVGGHHPIPGTYATFLCPSLNAVFGCL
jgi:hypothetical protein